MLLASPSKCCCGQRRIPGGCDFPTSFEMQLPRWPRHSIIFIQAWFCFSSNQWEFLKSTEKESGAVRSCVNAGSTRWSDELFKTICNSSTLEVRHLDSEMSKLKPCAHLPFSFTCVHCNLAYTMMFCFLSGIQDRWRMWQECVWDDLVSV